MDENNTQNPKVQWWKSLLGKKWTFPAIYLVASVLIVTLLWSRSDTGNYQLSKEDGILNEQPGYTQEDPNLAEVDLNLDLLDGDVDGTGEATPVTADQLKVIWPLEISEKAEIVRKFYDQSASQEERVQAIYEYQNTIYTSRGLDIIKGGEKFDVLAVADGKVVMAEEDLLHGKTIKIAHGDGFETVYASLSSMIVQVGDEITAGTKIGQAGKCQIKKDLPNHLYFEAYRSGELVNPVSVLPPLTEERT